MGSNAKHGAGFGCSAQARVFIMTETASAATPGDNTDGTRRDFLLVTTSTVGAVGTALVAWPFIDSMNPAADVRALSSTEVDIAPIEVGQAITIVWRGKPVFIRHRTPKEIEEAGAVALDDLPDPQADAERVTKPEWLIMVGICTHLGCIPLGQRRGEPKGDYGGWFCPCHGSHYDSSGRVRKGPAPKNLAVPTYAFIEDSTVRVG
jgi:ubiquinol-cytochrome c reductase iron-sulfur subunit